MRNIIFTITVLINSVGFAGQDSGGGGGFCLNGNCITLAEAGFRIQKKEKEEISPVPYTIFAEAEWIINELPLKGARSPTV